MEMVLDPKAKEASWLTLETKEGPLSVGILVTQSKRWFLVES